MLTRTVGAAVPLLALLVAACGGPHPHHGPQKRGPSQEERLEQQADEAQQELQKATE
jgi:hypothetical protein